MNFIVHVQLRKYYKGEILQRTEVMKPPLPEEGQRRFFFERRTYEIKG
jgi:hypothetical protein